MLAAQSASFISTSMALRDAFFGATEPERLLKWASRILLSKSDGLTVSQLAAKSGQNQTSSELSLLLRSDARFVIDETRRVFHVWEQDVARWSKCNGFFMPTAPWSPQMCQFVEKRSREAGLFYSSKNFSVKVLTQINVCCKNELIIYLQKNDYAGTLIFDIFKEYPHASRDLYDLIADCASIFFDGTQIWWSGPVGTSSTRFKRRKIGDSGAICVQ